MNHVKPAPTPSSVSREVLEAPSDFVKDTDACGGVLLGILWKRGCRDTVAPAGRAPLASLGTAKLRTAVLQMSLLNLWLIRRWRLTVALHWQ